MRGREAVAGQELFPAFVGSRNRRLECCSGDPSSVIPLSRLLSLSGVRPHRRLGAIYGPDPRVGSKRLISGGLPKQRPIHVGFRLLLRLTLYANITDKECQLWKVPPTALRDSRPRGESPLIFNHSQSCQSISIESEGDCLSGRLRHCKVVDIVLAGSHHRKQRDVAHL